MSICKRCKGRGYTKAEAPVVKDCGRKASPRYVTLSLGSGCTECHGKGSI
jgi:RecJ-like exonuclease